MYVPRTPEGVVSMRTLLATCCVAVLASGVLATGADAKTNQQCVDEHADRVLDCGAQYPRGQEAAYERCYRQSGARLQSCFSGVKDRQSGPGTSSGQPTKRIPSGALQQTQPPAVKGGTLQKLPPVGIGPDLKAPGTFQTPLGGATFKSPSGTFKSQGGAFK